MKPPYAQQESMDGDAGFEAMKRANGWDTMQLEAYRRGDVDEYETDPGNVVKIGRFGLESDQAERRVREAVVNRWAFSEALRIIEEHEAARLAEQARLEPPRLVSISQMWDTVTELETPSIGFVRDDGRQLLYAGKWHTLVGLAGSGKSMLAVAHCAEEIRRLDGRGLVVYAHFEEATPNGTISRLKAMGITAQQAERFVWVNGALTRVWSPESFADALMRVTAYFGHPPTLVVLDGIKAACGVHGWDVEKDATGVAPYRRTLVAPALELGATVLSLGHPVKDRTRQGEGHAYGASGWLDEVDGAAFRLELGSSPIGLGRSGASALYSAKDRPGGVNAGGQPDAAGAREVGWFYQGMVVVDSTEEIGEGHYRTRVRLTTPKPAEAAGNPYELMADQVHEYLSEHGGRFASVTALATQYRIISKSTKIDNNAFSAVLQLLVDQGRLVWPEVDGRGRPRPGWLAVPEDGDTPNLTDLFGSEPPEPL
jgi:hypothetical protein